MVFVVMIEEISHLQDGPARFPDRQYGEGGEEGVEKSGAVVPPVLHVGRHCRLLDAGDGLSYTGFLRW